MTPAPIFTSEAQTDLDEIFDFIAVDDPRRTDHHRGYSAVNEAAYQCKPQ